MTKSHPCRVTRENGRSKALPPSTVASEEIIERDAPAALRALRGLKALDLVEILGLAPYAKEKISG